MMKRTTIITFLCLLVYSAQAVKQVTIKVEAGLHNRINCVVSADLSSLNMDGSSSLLLKETTKNRKNEEIPCQLIMEKGIKPVVYWIIDGTMPAGTSRTYVLKQKKKKPKKAYIMRFEDDSTALTLTKSNEPILTYKYSVTSAPNDADKALERSGYIHPAYTPSGIELTSIQPEDNPYHYGIWSPWAQLEYQGSIYDLCNLGEKQGTVRAQSIINSYQGDVMSGYSAMLNHIIFTPSGENNIMNELWKVKAWNVPNGFLWDFESSLQANSQDPIILKEYQYGGFTYRANSIWKKGNCEIVSSEGRVRSQLNGSTANWIYICGKMKNGLRSGLLIMSHPDNFNAPQPLYIGDEKANDESGDALINFTPTQNMDWTLNPNNVYSLQYRLYAFDGDLTYSEAERLWFDYAEPPIVTIEK